MILRWIFIDIGGPILDDGPLFRYLAEALRDILHEQGRPVTEESFQKAMRLGWRQGAPSTLDFIVRHFTLSEEEFRRTKEAYWQVYRDLSDEQYRSLQILRPGVPQALRELSSRFELATLSNNIVRVQGLLEDYGIAGFFNASGISEEVGYSKPDLRLFQHVLRQADCRPEEAMMVGDRLDNDILPARNLGLMTAHVKLEHNFGATNPALDRIDPDYEVSSLQELAQLLMATSSSARREGVFKEDVGPSRSGGAR
jgi:HAD superfamily hydrolase (TIGR01549 family)